MITHTMAVRSVVERNIIFFKRDWIILVAGFAEPVFWLIAIAFGLSAFVDPIMVDGVAVEYTQFVVPGLIATSAMNAAAFDSTFNFFFKLNQIKIFDAMLTTPLTIGNIVLGEVAWSVLRATIYSAGFIAIATAFGYIDRWWGVLILPVAALIGFTISAVGIFSTTFVRNWHDFDYFGLAIQLLFIGSATFYPITVYPQWVQWLLYATPLYHGVAVCRSLALGTVGLSDLGHIAAMLAIMATFGLWAKARLATKLLS